MPQQTTTNATEGRSRFFELLNRVAKGEDVTIVKTDTGLRFKIILETEPNKKVKRNLMKEWDNFNIKIPPLKELKKLIYSMRNPK